MKVGEDSPASTDAFSLYLNKKVVWWLSKECESVEKDSGEKCILLQTPTAAVSTAEFKIMHSGKKCE